MSMNFYLKAPDGELEKRYPPVMRSPADEFPGLCEFYDEENDEEGFYVKVEQSTIPTVNMSNSNFMYVLKDIMGIDTHGDYCGDLEDLRTARASLMLHSHPDCYYGITATLELINLAIVNNWEIYYA